MGSSSLLVVSTAILFLAAISVLAQDGYFSPETFPGFFSPDCSRDYHFSRARYYLCDPNNVLGHTSSHLLNKILADWWTHCGLMSVKFPEAEDRYLTLGVAVSKFMLLNTNETCGFDLSVPSGKKLQFLLENAAKSVQNSWKRGNCPTDLLILVLEEAKYCDRRLWKHSSGLSATAALSERILNRIHRLNTSLSLIKSQNLALTEYEIVNLISEIVTHYQNLLGQVLRKSPASYDQRTTASLLRRPAQLIVKHSVPIWAVVLFVCALTIAFICAYLGHWFNITHKFPSRVRGARTGLMGKMRSSHKRKWGAGFLGGVMEMRQQPAAGQLPRPKLFGGLGGRRFNTSQKAPSRF